jgi:hypothetical protein
LEALDPGADSPHGVVGDVACTRDGPERDGRDLLGVLLAAWLDQAGRESDLTSEESAGNLPGAAKRFREVRGGGHAVQVFV